MSSEKNIIPAWIGGFKESVSLFPYPKPIIATLTGQYVQH
jgi:hypothetical protein